jgi:O-antigen ligase/tetratricopeptide (TPR) repeat protein
VARKKSNKPSVDIAVDPSISRPPMRVVASAAAQRPASDHQLIDDLPALVLGISAAVLPRLVEIGIRDLYQLPKIFAMSVGAAWMLAATALIAMLGRPLMLGRTPLKWPLLGMVASIAISVAVAPDETGGVLSLFAKMDAYRWISALVIGALTMVTVRTPRQLVYVVGGMLLGGLQVAFFGIAQNYNIRGWLPEDARRWVGINAPGSTFGNRNMAAQLIVSVMPGAYVLIAMSLRWWRQNRVQLALAVGLGANFVLFMLLVYLRLSVTRSAWGGAALGLAVAGVLYVAGTLLERRKTRSEADVATLAKLKSRPGRSFATLALTLGGSGLVALLVAGILLFDAGFKASYDTGVGDRKRKMSVVELIKTVGDTEDAHWAMRRMMWASTWEAIKSKPQGGGAGNWRVLFPQHVTRRENNDHFSIAKQPTRAHNDFLQIWSEFGLQGFLSFMGLIVISLWLAMKTAAIGRRPKLRDNDELSWMVFGALASCAGLVAICGDALLSFPFQLPAPTFFFLIHVGVVGAAWLFAQRAEAAAYPLSVETAQVGDDSLAMPAAAVVSPSWRPLNQQATIALVVSALMAVGFVHWENARLLEAERGFTFARAKQKRGEAGAALIEIQKAVEINGDDFQNHFIEGLCHNSLRDMPKAIDAIERSLRLYPNLLNAWVNLALFAQKAGDEPTMQRALDTALALKPDEVYALNTRSRWLNSKEKYDETIAVLAPFLDRHHDNEQFLANLSEAYSKLGRWSDVAAVREHEARNVRPAHIDDESPGGPAQRKRDGERVRKGRIDGWAAVGEAWGLAGNHAAAATAFGKAAAVAGRSRGELKRKLALAYVRAEDWPRAWHETGVAMDVDPSGEGALLAELGAIKQNAKGDDEKTHLDRLIARVHAMAKAKGGR